ncbi:depupylase/deamidase Dop [Occultella kanbiaonis]|uniref:depupylase/deamidase Dop n=1 Tax=Occultella kanbiaonis TaxID=2675754 RepID=UPI001F27B5A1|nr:depupylase/deamidase Dop [Occultella kanbiaonis]
MTVRRIMGIETEYGILGIGNPGANPMLMSAQVVTAYANEGVHGGSRARWDYQDEDPLRDARGWSLDRSSAHPSQLTDNPSRPAPDGDRPDDGGAGSDGGTGGADEATGVHWGGVTQRRRPAPQPEPATVANVILPNGARYYVDHAHPEYSSPEVTGPLDAVRWDRAGEEVLLRSARLLAQIPGMPQVALYKNNTDGKGASYGTHENYLVDRDVPFDDIIDYLTPFLVTRPVFCGAGRLGRGQRGEQPGYQISQRADFIEAEVGLETTLRRPIINTRDEPHADATRYRRLHVIVGDANMHEVSTYLKLGTTSVLLWLLEQGQVPLELSALRLADPVGAAHAVSHDLSLGIPLDLADGRRMTALQIQRVYVDVITAAVGANAERTGTAPDGQTADVLARWSDLVTRLADAPASCAREVEWLAKLRVLDGMRTRDDLPWDHPRLAALDLQWSDLRPERGIYAKMAAARAVERLVEAADVERAITHPPEDTRAYFRGEAIRRFPDAISAANWDAIVFDVPGLAHLQRVPTADPLRGTRRHVGELLDAHTDAGSLLRALTAVPPPAGESGT